VITYGPLLPLREQDADGVARDLRLSAALAG
jgi:hypothetical protein